MAKIVVRIPVCGPHCRKCRMGDVAYFTRCEAFGKQREKDAKGFLRIQECLNAEREFFIMDRYIIAAECGNQSAMMGYMDELGSLPGKP
jgi:hypothetical protein